MGFSRWFKWICGKIRCEKDLGDDISIRSSSSVTLVHPTPSRNLPRPSNYPLPPLSNGLYPLQGLTRGGIWMSCGPPKKSVTIMPLEEENTGLIYIDGRLLQKALGDKYGSGNFDASQIHVTALNKLHEIERLKLNGSESHSGVRFECPEKDLKDLIQSTTIALQLCQDYYGKSGSVLDVNCKHRATAFVLHRKRVLYCDGDKEWKGLLYFDGGKFLSIQEEDGADFKALPYNVAGFASGKCWLKPIEKESA
ncbi:hypothetical protein V501_01175 [Pseudogymnoascus sp. VKM F-4519 (FW-2642)]|nr:hypothetical protein V501_01175 [Pseudogymnoascus sp. VKM F-4519 (FW-2642)]